MPNHEEPLIVHVASDPPVLSDVAAEKKEVAEESIVDTAATKQQDGAVAVHTLEREGNVLSDDMLPATYQLAQQK
ncbi:hypothetical protein A2U01_0015609, partial [Trifolium medium]|nr:hypothetical protein [Trifolium medium]